MGVTGDGRRDSVLALKEPRACHRHQGKRMRNCSRKTKVFLAQGCRNFAMQPHRSFPAVLRVQYFGVSNPWAC
jgi:hypothetical protein